MKTFDDVDKLPTEKIKIERWTLGDTLDTVINTFDPYVYDWESISDDGRLEHHVIAFTRIDSRRYEELGKITLDGETLALYKRAGREGSDDVDVFFKKQSSYNELISHLTYWVESELIVKNGEDDEFDFDEFNRYGSSEILQITPTEV